MQDWMRWFLLFGSGWGRDADQHDKISYWWENKYTDLNISKGLILYHVFLYTNDVIKNHSMRIYCDLSLSLVVIKFTFFSLNLLNQHWSSLLHVTKGKCITLSEYTVSSLLNQNFNNLSTFMNMFYYFVFKRQTNNEHITNNECENRRPQNKKCWFIPSSFRYGVFLKMRFSIDSSGIDKDFFLTILKLICTW